MDFIAVLSMLATGFFAGSTTVAWAGYQLEKRHNAKLEMKICVLEGVLDYGWNHDVSFDKAVEIVMDRIK